MKEQLLSKLSEIKFLKKAIVTFEKRECQWTLDFTDKEALYEWLKRYEDVGWSVRSFELEGEWTKR